MFSKPADKGKVKEQLTADQYEVCWNKETESSFSGEYHDCKDKCICCRNSPFSFDTKFGSGTDWPSFWTPVKEGSVKQETDKSYGMVRMEVMCGAQLGHVFVDGSNPIGLSYCVNSLSLSLPKGAADEQ